MLRICRTPAVTEENNFSTKLQSTYARESCFVDKFQQIIVRQNCSFDFYAFPQPLSDELHSV
jgi:hypothetical protein